jgi:hypothetical protein
LPGGALNEEIAMLKVVVLMLAVAFAFLAQTKLPAQWTAACVNSECIVGP